MRNFLLGLWLFVMGIVLTYCCKIVYAAATATWGDAARTDLIIAVTLSTLGMIPLFVLVYLYRRDLNEFGAICRARSAARSVDSSLVASDPRLGCEGQEGVEDPRGWLQM